MKHMHHMPCLLLLLFTASAGLAQNVNPDTSRTPFQRGGIYDRPYLVKLGGRTAVGGYAEMNSNYLRSDGVVEGFAFEQRRFNLFLFAPVSERVKLTSELEFEHGTEEIKLETALVDVLLATPLNVRAGVLLVPLGRFNLAHDSPRYNIIDRPLVSTAIIPATYSEAGAGFFGAWYYGPLDRLTYELYAVNGLQDGVVLGSGEGTRIPAGKTSEAFAEDNNGAPALTGRLGWNPRWGGEWGFSFYTGQYNKHLAEGAAIDAPRHVRLLALDADYRWRRLSLRGEAAVARIDTPDDHVDDDLLARHQQGLFLEGNYTLLRRPVLGMPDASLTVVCRFDEIDLNHGRFDKTGEDIGEVTRRLTTGLAFRPNTETVIRVNYWRQWQYDRFNHVTHSMNLQGGVATYF